MNNNIKIIENNQHYQQDIHYQKPNEYYQIFTEESVAISLYTFGFFTCATWCVLIKMFPYS